MGPGTYGSQKVDQRKKERSAKARTGSFPTGQLKMNMKKMPPAVQKRLMQAMKRKKK